MATEIFTDVTPFQKKRIEFFVKYYTKMNNNPEDAARALLAFRKELEGEEDKLFLDFLVRCQAMEEEE